MVSHSPPSKRRKKSDKGSSPLVVFAHGAGAPSTSDWMIRYCWIILQSRSMLAKEVSPLEEPVLYLQLAFTATFFAGVFDLSLGLLRWKDMLKEALGAVEVVTFDYPYFAGGKRKAPPKAEKLVDYHLGVVKDATTKYPGHPLVLAGKSMGSRISCMVASAEDIHISAIICLGYPLKGTNGAVRDETLLQLTVPTMFVQGSKDGLCPLDKLEATRKKMKCINELHVIDGGDHSFKIGKKFLESIGSNQDEAERKAVEAIVEFVSQSIK